MWFDECGLDVNMSLLGLANASVLMVSLRAAVATPNISEAVNGGGDAEAGVVSSIFGTFTST